jgi:sugar phosphate isomerase/epimerase
MVLSARMQFDGLHLSYCTNIHPGEDLPSVRRALGAHVARVKALVSPDAPFGLGLRLGNTAAATLHADAGERAALVAELGRLDMYVFTLNGFPYGDFAATSVKAAVYEPSWLDAERIAYTTRLAEVLADLPGPPRRTISTVSGCFRPTADDDAAHARIARNLGEVATELARIADRTGVGVRLCLEPEPWTTLETTDDAIDLFERHLFPLGAPARDHLGLCYDCCHQAVHFEDAAEGAAP